MSQRSDVSKRMSTQKGRREVVRVCQRTQLDGVDLAVASAKRNHNSVVTLASE